MKQVFLVDSENVGEIWIDLLNYCQEQDEVLVFYTTNSPHIGYENVQKLLRTKKQADFIKCYEGTNGLDFQLVTELGYRIGSCADAEVEYIVVTNDNGFEAAVKYWKDREKPVKRYNAKFCKMMFQKGTEDKKKPDRERKSEKKEPAEKQEQKNREQAAKEPAAKKQPEEKKEPKTQEILPEQQAEKEPAAEPDGKEQKAPRKTNSGRKRGRRKTETVEIRKEEALPEVVVTVETVQNEMVQQNPEQLKESDELIRKALQEEPKNSQPESIPAPIIMQEEKSSGVAVVPPTSTSEQAQTAGSGEARPEESQATDREETQARQEEAPAEADGALSPDIMAIASCLGDNRESLHNALVIFFGDEAGKEFYQKIKEQVDFKSMKKAEVKERFADYCRIVFDKSEPQVECPKELPAYVYQAADKRKNLNSFRAALQKKFGKEQGLQYYTVLKNHMKILNRI